MATIGAFGDLVFETSGLKILTFNDFKRTSKAKYASHEVIGNPPVLEFVGRELEEFTLRIKLISKLGVNPAQEAKKLRDVMFNAEPNFLIISNTVYGENEFVITDISEAVDYWDGKGNVLVNTLDVTFKEYVPRAD